MIVPSDAEVVAAFVRKKTLPTRSWILVDASGEGTVIYADKQAIMQRVRLHARDLRILDPLLSYPSTILRRERAIVLNLEHIKAIITCNEVLLRDPLDEDVIPVVEEIQRRLPPASLIPQDQGQNEVEADEEDETPFEFLVLEVALNAICSFLAARTTELEEVAYPALDELTSKISSCNLDKVRKVKSEMTRLSARIQKVRDELDKLLDDDADMSGLCLSRRLAGASPVSGSVPTNLFSEASTISEISRASRACVATVPGDGRDIEKLAMLLEANFLQIDSTLNKLTTLHEYINDTEDYINIQVDSHRNQLIQLELFLNSVNFSLTFFSLVAGVFGVSIPYKWNHGHGYMFKWVLIITGIVCSSVIILIMYYARYKGLVGY